MYINHRKFEEKEEKYVELKTKAKKEEVKETPQDRKNKVFLKGMLERMSNEKYI